MAVLGGRPQAAASAQEIAVRDGVAPGRVQSGQTCVISRRMAKPQFDRQTWIEYAKCSTLRCGWARQFVEAKLKAGKTYYTAMRALACKWSRIFMPAGRTARSMARSKIARPCENTKAPTVRQPQPEYENGTVK